MSTPYDAEWLEHDDDSRPVKRATDPALRDVATEAAKKIGEALRETRTGCFAARIDGVLVVVATDDGPRGYSARDIEAFLTAAEIVADVERPRSATETPE
jgi:hypothetical protein